MESSIDGSQWKGGRASLESSIDSSQWEGGRASSNRDSLPNQMSGGESLSSNMTNQTVSGINMHLSLSLNTRMGNNINALISEGSISDSLGLGDTLLLLSALFLRHKTALVFLHFLDTVGALGHSAGEALLLRNIFEGC